MSYRFLTKPLAYVIAVGGVPLMAAADDASGNNDPVTIQDFENPDFEPEVWVVNMPGKNASVELTTDHPQQGKQCLKLHYKFGEERTNAYIGVPVPVRVSSPINQLLVQVRGDSSQCGFLAQIIDASGETHQRFSDNLGGKINFTGWKQVMFTNLNATHESWGGDKNGKIDYPITRINLILSRPSGDTGLTASEGDVCIDTLSADATADADELPLSVVSVISPKYGADIQGDTTLSVSGRGFRNLTVRSWKPDGRFGTDSVVGTIKLDRQGRGSIVFPADQFPHGPISVRITGEDSAVRDNCYLQLYNTGGISWSEGIPSGAPPAARSMKLRFADDFDGPLSISRDGHGATYASHKLGGGDFSGIPFGNHENPQTSPFLQRDTWLRIRADESRNTTGLIASVDRKGQGITARAPCYFECRFIAQSATGTWPAFWVMTNYMRKLDGSVAPLKIPADELDVFEGYGGEGPGNPNQTGYWIVTHWWNQDAAGKRGALRPGFNGQIQMTQIRGDGGATWWEAPHVYSVLVDIDDTMYYCDDIEVARHKTGRLSAEEPLFFYINLAIGGTSGWRKDLSRYDGVADMYVDYVRIFQGD